jgi:hypothetical protein
VAVCLSKSQEDDSMMFPTQSNASVVLKGVSFFWKARCITHQCLHAFFSVATYRYDTSCILGGIIFVSGLAQSGVGKMNSR